MPTYAYACTECDHRFEAVQSFSDDSLTVCPECEGRLRKVFNAVGIVFKGGGFYRTDSRSGSSVTAGSSSSGWRLVGEQDRVLSGVVVHRHGDEDLVVHSLGLRSRMPSRRA